MHEGKRNLATGDENDDQQAGDGDLQLTIKRYASPGGANTISSTEVRYCVKSPASGALNGLLLEKKEENGRTPSRPSSWTTSTHVSISNGQSEMSYLCLGRIRWKADSPAWKGQRRH